MFHQRQQQLCNFLDQELLKYLFCIRQLHRRHYGDFQIHHHQQLQDTQPCQHHQKQM
jgi:hypothetical protein